MTDTMTLAGWRPMPDEQTRKRWEDLGGRWMRVPVEGRMLGEGAWSEQAGLNGWEDWGDDSDFLFRPVHPSTWDHMPSFWLLAEGRPVVPTVGMVTHGQPYRWWRDDQLDPTPVWIGDGRLKYMAETEDGWDEADVTDDGHWISPVVKPGRVA